MITGKKPPKTISGAKSSHLINSSTAHSNKAGAQSSPAGTGLATPKLFLTQDDIVHQSVANLPQTLTQDDNTHTGTGSTGTSDDNTQTGTGSTGTSDDNTHTGTGSSGNPYYSDPRVLPPQSTSLVPPLTWPTSPIDFYAIDNYKNTPGHLTPAHLTSLIDIAYSEPWIYYTDSKGKWAEYFIDSQGHLLPYAKKTVNQYQDSKNRWVNYPTNGKIPPPYPITDYQYYDSSSKQWYTYKTSLTPKNQSGYAPQGKPTRTIQAVKTNVSVNPLDSQAFFGPSTAPNSTLFSSWCKPLTAQHSYDSKQQSDLLDIIPVYLNSKSQPVTQWKDAEGTTKTIWENATDTKNLPYLTAGGHFVSPPNSQYVSEYYSFGFVLNNKTLSANEITAKETDIKTELDDIFTCLYKNGADPAKFPMTNFANTFLSFLKAHKSDVFDDLAKIPPNDCLIQIISSDLNLLSTLSSSIDKLILGFTSATQIPLYTKHRELLYNEYEFQEYAKIFYDDFRLILGNTFPNLPTSDSSVHNDSTDLNYGTFNGFSASETDLTQLSPQSILLGTYNDSKNNLKILTLPKDKSYETNFMYSVSQAIQYMGSAISDSAYNSGLKSTADTIHQQATLHEYLFNKNIENIFNDLNIILQNPFVPNSTTPIDLTYEGAEGTQVYKINQASSSFVENDLAKLSLYDNNIAQDTGAKKTYEEGLFVKARQQLIHDINIFVLNPNPLTLPTPSIVPSGNWNPTAEKIYVDELLAYDNYGICYQNLSGALTALDNVYSDGGSISLKYNNCNDLDILNIIHQVIRDSKNNYLSIYNDIKNLKAKTTNNTYNNLIYDTNIILQNYTIPKKL